MKPIIILNMILLVAFTGCSKDYLEKKPKSDILVPATLDDFQKLLDNIALVNTAPAIGRLATDEFYFQDNAAWQATFRPAERNAYIWASDVYEGVTVRDWNDAYAQIFYANTVLAGIEKVPLTKGNLNDWNRIKGWAYFVRAFALYGLAETFCVPFDTKAASKALGIPVRLHPEIDELVQRGTLQQTYDQVFSDLQEAGNRLPRQVDPNFPSRPSYPTNLALMARIYLNMRDYTSALRYADSSLLLYNALLDYNSVSPTSSRPFNQLNKELLYYCSETADYNSLSIIATTSIIDSTLYRSYATNDLRKAIFFKLNSKGLPIIKRGYGASAGFGGIATDEVYLIKAECLARTGQASPAMSVLNELLIKRWANGMFTPLSASSPAAALSIILGERRKELVWRSARWSDIRRLNMDGAGITLTRVLNGQTYTLPPNDPRYAFPIPDDEIALSHIEQNPR